jgi:hypothetical protein
MFGGFLQHETLNMQRRGASFYMLANSISTRTLKDLNISLNLIHPMLINFHTWFGNCMVYTRMRKIHTSVPIWIPFWFGGWVCLLFVGAKDLLTFHMCNSNYASRSWGIFSKLCLQVASNFHIGLLYARVVHSYWTFDLVDHPAWNDNTMSIVWKLEHNHPMSQHTNMLPFCEIVEAIHCALFLKNKLGMSTSSSRKKLYKKN